MESHFSCGPARGSTQNQGRDRSRRSMETETTMKRWNEDMGLTRSGAWLLALAALWLLVGVGCAGKRGKIDKPQLQQGARSHLAYLQSDVEVVFSLNHLAKRAETAVKSRAYAQFRKFVERTSEDPEVAKNFERVDKFDEFLGQYLKGRVTIGTTSNWDTVMDEGDLLIIVDADVQPMLQVLSETFEEEPFQFTPVGEGIVEVIPPESASDDEVQEDPFAVAAEGAGEDKLYLAQRGPVGLMSNDIELLRKTMSVAQELEQALVLTDDPDFKGLFDGLNPDSDMLLYMRDWTGDLESEWDAMLGSNSGAPMKRGFAATANLTGGLDLELVIDADPGESVDPDLKAILPALTAVQKAPALPAQVPVEALAYMGVHISVEALMSEFKKQMTAQDMPMPPFEDKLDQIMASLEGEFGVAVTSEPKGAVNPMLGFPMPGVVAMARLTSADAGAVIQAGLAEIFTTLQQGPEPMLGPAQKEAYGDTDVTFHLTQEGLEVGYAFNGDVMLIGNREGLRDMLQRPIEKSLAKDTTFPIVTDSLAQKSNYQVHFDLQGVYGAVLGQLGPMVALMSNGMLGTPDDPLAVTLRVFRYIGGYFSYEDERLRARLYLTARDLR